MWGGWGAGKLGSVRRCDVTHQSRDLPWPKKTNQRHTRTLGRRLSLFVARTSRFLFSAKRRGPGTMTVGKYSRGCAYVHRHDTPLSSFGFYSFPELGAVLWLMVERRRRNGGCCASVALFHGILLRTRESCICSVGSVL